MGKSIKEEFPRRNWHSNQQVAVTNIMFTNHWLKGRIGLALDPYKITMQQYNALRLLRAAHPEGLVAGVIRSGLLDRTSDVSRLRGAPSHSRRRQGKENIFNPSRA